MPPCPAPRDQVDEILAQWRTERPDLDPSPMAIVGRICRLAPYLYDVQNRVFALHGLQFAEFDILATLRRRGHPYSLTPSELASSMMVTPSAVAQRLAKLEDKDLIMRSHDHGDRRKVTVTLLPAGHGLVDRVIKDHLINENLIIEEFTSEELGLLASFLRRLLLRVRDKPAGLIG